MSVAYDTAGNIVSDAASELGLGAITDPYGSTDANVIQLCGLLKSGGRKLVFERDWTHLVAEYSFVTWKNWAASTGYTAGATTWTQGRTFAVGDLARCGAGTATFNLYRCTTAGVTSLFSSGPFGFGSSITDGSCVWAFQNAGSASIVTHGLYYYTCTTTGTSGTIGPLNYNNGNSAGLEGDGTATWSWTGNAADYALPAGFSNMLDQTDWNRTNRLPLGGPVSAQEWQYLKGRQQGVVFNVLFRPVAGLLRLYPDTDTPGGYTIAFEYISGYWASATGGTAPTKDAPTISSDIVYFDPLLMTRKLKLDWLSTKGFDTSAAQSDYDDVFEQVCNADGSSPILNLEGRSASGSLIGARNIPFTGFGS